jgi:segregation and condensation protein B
VGRPALLATTKHFLEDLGLASLDQLPALSEVSLAEALGDSDEADSSTAVDPEASNHGGQTSFMGLNTTDVVETPVATPESPTDVPAQLPFEAECDPRVASDAEPTQPSDEDNHPDKDDDHDQP